MLYSAQWPEIVYPDSKIAQPSKSVWDEKKPEATQRAKQLQATLATQ